MNVRPPKAWESLTASQRKKIEEYAQSIAKEQLEKDGRLMLDLYIKMVCVTLHEAFGFGEMRLNYFLVNHTNLFRDQRQKVSAGTQLEHLDNEMKKIFRKFGFPQKIFDKLLGPVEKEDTE